MPLVPKLDNAPAIESLLSMNKPGGSTPTALSIHLVADSVKDLPLMGNGRKIIVLATDGQPNVCGSGGSMTDDTPATPAAASYAFGLGIKVYVLGVGPQTSDANLQAVANAGQGVTCGAMYYKGSSPTDLVSAFNAIIGGARSCTLKLSGALQQTDAPSGDIELNGTKLGYDDPNGWSLTDSTTIQLAGTACTTYLDTSAALTATFPCGTQIL